MPAAFIQQREGISLVAGTTVQCSSNLIATAGNHLLLIAFYSSGSAKTVTWPSAWGTVVELGNFFNATDSVGWRWGHVQNCAAASNAGQITLSASVGAAGIRIREVTGIATIGAYLSDNSINRQVNPGTGAGAITAAVTPSTQPAWIDGMSTPLASSNWDTAVSDTSRTRIWDVGGSAFIAKPQDARVTSTSAKTLTWTTSFGTDTYHSLAIAFAEAIGGGARISSMSSQPMIRGPM